MIMMTVVSYCRWACSMHAYRFCCVKKCYVFWDKKCHYQVSSTASSFSRKQISARKLDVRTEFRYVPLFETGTSIALRMKLLLISACFPIHYYLTNLLFNAVFWAPESFALRYEAEGRWFDFRWGLRIVIDLIFLATLWSWGRLSL